MTHEEIEPFVFPISAARPVARARDVQEVEVSVVHHEQQIALQPIRVVDIG
jgi:hypothetical protein